MTAVAQKQRGCATRTMADDGCMFIACVVDENGLADQCAKGNNPNIMDARESTS